jgi:Protein of unknown function (DUF2523)
MPAVLAFLWPLVTGALTTFLTWVFRKAVLVFLITTSIYFLIEFLGPMVVRLLANYTGINPVTLLNDIPASIWWFASALRIDFAIKVIFAALATRFLIRRIPFIG